MQPFHTRAILVTGAASGIGLATARHLAAAGAARLVLVDRDAEALARVDLPCTLDLLPGDVALRAGAAASGLPSDPRALVDWAARTAPWRSYLSAHLWRAAPVRPPRRARPTSRTRHITTTEETS